MDENDARIAADISSRTMTKMTLAATRSSNGTRVAVKREAAAAADKSRSPSTTPIGSKNVSPSPTASPDTKVDSSGSNGSIESMSTPDTTSTPKLSRKSSSVAPKSVGPPVHVFFGHLPDATAEAKSQFQVIPDCLYGSKHMGSSDHDAFECDCAENWDNGQNIACGEDSDCINRATKMECVRGDCNCGETCQNQRFQRKQYAQVSVFKTEKKGFGLRADAALRANDFIYEYIGEVINEPAFRRRMLQYDEEGIRHFYFMSLTKHEFVDATRKGNLGRFCNHSCRPNCYVDKWVVGNKLRMGIFAGRAIQAGEELVFDYNVDRYGAEPQPCYCGEDNCTGFIGGKTQTERATKLSAATIEALGIEDPDSWDTAVARKSVRRKRANEDDEAYVGSLETSGLAEDGVTKVMAALMQCKEKWIAVKLLARIQSARDDERVLQRVTRMHGYQILGALLTTFHDDGNVVLQVLDVLDRLPRLTKNKISDSNIESVIQGLITASHEGVAAGARHLLDAWSKLETAYRIPRKKVDSNAPTVSSFEDRRRGGASADDDDNNSSNSGPIRQPAPRSALSPFHGMAVPKGPRSSIPQRNASFHNNNNPNINSPRNLRRGPQGQTAVVGASHGLPNGWYATTDANGTTYYYAEGRAPTWQRPTQPTDKAPSRAQQKNDAVQEIINSIVKEETPRPSPKGVAAAYTTQSPAAETKKDRWRSYPVEKQMRIYENTLSPHIRGVMDRFRNRLPKDELKKLAKEISKKLVASDFKNRRVEDPTTISSRQEKKVKAYVKDFFERAVAKYDGMEKAKTEHGPRDTTISLAEAAAATPDVIIGDTPGPTMTDKGLAVVNKDETPLTDENESPDAAGRKRKRADSESHKFQEVHEAEMTAAAPGRQGGLSSPSLPPSEAPGLSLHKRLREDGEMTDASVQTPPPPPPPPPPEGESSSEEQRLMLEQEEELVRENEEAMRAFEEEQKEHAVKPLGSRNGLEQLQRETQAQKMEVVGH